MVRDFDCAVGGFYDGSINLDLKNKCTVETWLEFRDLGIV